MTRNVWMWTRISIRLKKYVLAGELTVELVLVDEILVVPSSAKVVMAGFIR